MVRVLKRDVETDLLIYRECLEMVDDGDWLDNDRRFAKSGSYFCGDV